MLGAVALDIRRKGGVECPFEAVMTIDNDAPLVLQGHCKHYEQRPGRTGHQISLDVEVGEPWHTRYRSCSRPVCLSV